MQNKIIINTKKHLKKYLHIIKTLNKPIFFNRYKGVEQFAADVRLVFANCKTFNVYDSEVGRAGIAVSEFFENR